MKTLTLRTHFYTPTHFNLITKLPPRFNTSTKPIIFYSQKLKPTSKTIKPYQTNNLFIHKQTNPLLLSSQKVNNLHSSNDHSRTLLLGSLTVGLVMFVMGFDDQHKAMAFGPEGPLVEEFWDNMRRYGLYALSVSTGVLYAVFQPLYELLKNPISAILVLVILGGGFYVVSQVVSAMVGITDFSYELNY